MSEIHHCPRCASVLPDDAPEGLCPGCLLRGALDEPAVAGSVIEELTAPMSEEPPSPEPGSLLRYFGDYEMLEEIGRGGMGVVCKARQVSLGRTVAVKLVRAGRLATQAERERFRREAQALARLRHPNIVTIYEVGEIEGQLYFSMDYVEGRNLAEVISKGTWHPTAAAGLARTLAEAVDFAHREGTLHRDLKPSNILLDETGQPRITDFGLAKRLDGEVSLTASGEMLGTPGYMPPEQVARGGARPTPASDVYSLGAIFYELITGHPPFEGASALDVAMKALRREAPSPRVHAPELDRDVETICLKCLEKHPGRRYGSARELADDLGRYLRREPIRARPVNRPVRLWRWARRHPWPTVAGVALVLVAVLAAFSAWTLRERLWRSLIDQARMERVLGRRGNSLARLAEAARLKRTPELRQEAARTLTTAGIVPRHQFSHGYVEHLALSFDGRLLAVSGHPKGLTSAATWSEQLQVWDLGTGKALHGAKIQAGLWTGRPTFAFFPEAALLLYLRTPFIDLTSEPPRPRSTVLSPTMEEAVLWNPVTNQLVDSVRLDQPEAGRFEYQHWVVSAAGTRAARRNLAYHIELWDLDQGRAEVLPLAVVADPVAFLSEDELLLHSPPGLVLWDARTSESRLLTPSPLAWSTDGSTAVIEEEGEVRVVLLPEVKTYRLLPLEGQQPVKKVGVWNSPLRLSPRGRRLAVLEASESSSTESSSTLKTMDGAPVLTILDAASGDARDTPLVSRIALEAGSRIDIWRTAFRPGGTLLAATGALGGDGYLKIWNVETGEEVAHLDRHHTPHWSADGRLLATIGPAESSGSRRAGLQLINNNPPGMLVGNSTVHIWEVVSPPSYALARRVDVLAFSPDGDALVAGDTVWDVLASPDGPRLRRSNSQPRVRRSAARRRGHWVHLGSDGQVWAVEQVDGGFDSTNVVVRSEASAEIAIVHPWHVETPPETRTPYFSIRSTALSPDGRFLALLGYHGVNDGEGNRITARILETWDLQAQPPSRLWLRKADRSFKNVRWTPEGTFLTRDPDSDGLVFWDPISGQRRRSIAPAGSVESVLSPDGAVVFLQTSSGDAQVQDVSSGRRLGGWLGHDGYLALAVSRDGRLVASGGQDQVIRLSDLATGEELIRWTAHRGAVRSLTFDPSGETLASGGGDGRVKIWHLPSLRADLASLGLDWEEP